MIETDGVTSGTNLLANDAQGADGATVTAVDAGAPGFQAIAASGTTTLSTANGTYVFQADGTWSFDPNANLDNASGIFAGFLYLITDGDGDTSIFFAVYHDRRRRSCGDACAGDAGSQ